MLSTLPAELRAEIFRYVLPSNDRLRRAGNGWMSNLTSLLATSKRIYNESVDILYKSNSLTLTPHELRTFGDSLSFSYITELVIVDTTDNTPSKERSFYKFLKFILACVAKHSRCPRVEQLRLRSLTIKTSRLTYHGLQQLRTDTKASPYLKPSGRGVGCWSLGSNEAFEIKLVHTQLEGAWKSLQSSVGTNLKMVTDNIVRQGDRSPVDGKTMMEPHLHRAILAMKLLASDKSNASVLSGMDWCKRSAIAFVEPYIRETLKTGTAGKSGWQNEIDMVNSVLLQVVSS